jgi:hypothetical protein
VDQHQTSVFNVSKSRHMRPPAGRGGRTFGRSNASGRGVPRFSGAGRGRGRGQFRDDGPPATIEGMT